MAREQHQFPIEFAMADDRIVRRNKLRETLSELRNTALAELEHRGYEFRGKTRQWLRAEAIGVQASRRRALRRKKAASIFAASKELPIAFAAGSRRRPPYHYQTNAGPQPESCPLGCINDWVLWASAVARTAWLNRQHVEFLKARHTLGTR